MVSLNATLKLRKLGKPLIANNFVSRKEDKVQMQTSETRSSMSHTEMFPNYVRAASWGGTNLMSHYVRQDLLELCSLHLAATASWYI